MGADNARLTVVPHNVSSSQDWKCRVCFYKNGEEVILENVGRWNVLSEAAEAGATEEQLKSLTRQLIDVGDEFIQSANPELGRKWNNFTGQPVPEGYNG